MEIIRSMLPYIIFVIKNHQPIFKKPHFILITFFYFNSPAALAYCNTYNNTVTLSLPNLQVNQHSIPLNGTIGSELVSDPLTLSYCAGFDNTSSHTRYMSLYTNSNITINGRSIFKTSEPGIGVAIGVEPMNTGCSGIEWTEYGFCTQYSFTVSYRVKLHYQLYRIGPLTNISKVTFNSRYKIYEYVRSAGTPDGYPSLGPYVYYSGVNETINFNLTVATCSLQTAPLTAINLPSVSSGSFPSLYSTAFSVPFNITINCPSPTNLYITFTDNNSTSQTNNYLKPTTASTVKGIGVQLRYNNQIISFGPDSPDKGTINQIALSPNVSGTQTFPFMASYVRTGTVMPGSLSATATYTLSYQ